MMKAAKDEPMQLIGFDSDTRKFVINQQAINMIRQIKGPIGVISVAGVYRSGKSFLTNRMLLNRKQGFRVSSTVQPETKGIWIWGKPILGQTSKNQTINVLVLDTEGISSLDRQSTYDTKVIIMSILLSSLLIYNSIGAIQKSQIQTLHGVLKLVDKVSGSNTHSCPSLLWILRDFSLQLKSNEHILLTPLEYLQQSLRSPSNAIERQLIYKRFKNLDCSTLVRPLIDQNSLQYLDIADYESLAPQFVDQLIQLRRRILNNVVAKQFNNKVLNGEGWADMVLGYLQQLNSDKIPQLNNVWQYVCRSQCQKHSQIALQMYMTRLKQFSKKQVSEENMKLIYKQAKQQSLQYMYSKCKNNNQLPQYIHQLKQTFADQYSKIMTNLQKDNFQQIKEYINFQYQSIERKVKLKQIQTLWQYKKQIQMFNEFIKKKSTNNNCREYINEFINKKIFESAGYFQQILMNEFQNKNKELGNTIIKLEEELKISRKRQNQQRMELQTKLDKVIDQSKQYFTMLKSTEQSILQLKNSKEQAEREYWQQLLNQKSNYQKIIHQLKAKLSISENTTDEINRQKIILESELKKKDILYQKATQNYNQVLKEQKQTYIKLLDEYKCLKQSYHNDIKLSDSKHNLKIKQYTNTIEQLKTTINDNETKIEYLQQKKIQIEQRCKILQQQKRILALQLQGTITEVQNQSRLLTKRITQNKFKLQKAIHLQQQVISLTEQNLKLRDTLKQLHSQLDKEQALNHQKNTFLQIQLKDLRYKNEQHQQKFKQLLTNFNSQKIKLEQELSQCKNKQFQLRKAYNIQEISIDQLRNKNNDLKNALEQKQQQINNTMKLYKQRQYNLENSKIVLESQMRRLEEENIKGIKLTQKNAEEQIQRLNRELYKSKQQYQNDLEQIKQAFEQTLEQIRNLHQIQKSRMEAKLSEEKSKREKKPSGIENVQINKNIRQFNQKLQDKILELKKKMWDDQKQYKVKLSQLQTKLTIKNSQIQQIRNNTTIHIGSSYKQHDIQSKVLKIKSTQQKKQIEQKNLQNKRLLIQNSALNQSLKSRIEQIRKIKTSTQLTIHNLQSQLNTKKQQVNLLQKRMNTVSEDNSQFKRSVFSKQQSMLNQNKYLHSKITAKQQSPSKITTKNGIQAKVLLALKQIQAIQQIYGRTVKQMSTREEIYKTEQAKSYKQKSILQKKLQMLSEFDI